MDYIYSRNRIKLAKCKKKFKKNRNLKKIYFIIIFYSITITTSWYVLKSIDPIFEGLCISKATNIATEITNKKTSEVLARYNYKETVEIQEGENSKNKILKTDVVLLNEIISEIAIKTQEELEKMSRENIEIPIGALTGNKYFSAFGPKVKIRIMPTGNITTDIKTEFKSAGINQTIYRIYMEIECNVSILTSYKTISKQINNQILLVETVIVGEVPETYMELENN